MKYRFCLLLILIALLSACTGDDNKDEPTANTDPATIISEAATKLQEASSFQLVLEAGGAPIFIDVSNLGADLQLKFLRAQGTYIAPDKMQADVTVQLEDVSTDVNIIAIGDQQYYRHQVITLGQWKGETFASGFNPSAFSSEETGLANAVRSIKNPVYVGKEDLDGIEVYHIQGTIDASLVRSVTVGLIGTQTGDIKIDIYVRTRDNLLEKMVLEEPLQEGQTEPTIWTVGLYDYNEEYTIEAPEVQ